MKSKNRIVEKGTEIYYRIKPELEKIYAADKIVVIDINSGDYYVGESASEAAAHALKDHPDGAPFFSAFIGSVYGRI